LKAKRVIWWYRAYLVLLALVVFCPPLIYINALQQQIAMFWIFLLPVFCLIFLSVFYFPIQPWVWIHHLFVILCSTLLIAFIFFIAVEQRRYTDMFHLNFLIADVLDLAGGFLAVSWATLLVFWCKPEIKAYFGR